MNLLGARLIRILWLALAVGCGGPLNVRTPINKVLGGGGGSGGGGSAPDKLTVACTAALQKAQSALANNSADIATILVRKLPDENKTCAVVVRVLSHNTARADAKLIKGTSEFSDYSSIFVTTPQGSSRVPVWYDEPPKSYPPAYDAKGKLLDNTLKVDDCTAIAPLLAAGQPSSYVTMVPGSVDFGSACYLQISFKSENDFIQFLGWEAPPPAHLLFYWGNLRADGSGAYVPIYAYFRPGK